MYMAPPFLAYHAVAKGDLDLLHDTVWQCGLYAYILSGDEGTWEHIVGPTNMDTGRWSTGNG